MRPWSNLEACGMAVGWVGRIESEKNGIAASDIMATVNTDMEPELYSHFLSKPMI